MSRIFRGTFGTPPPRKSLTPMESVHKVRGRRIQMSKQKSGSKRPDKRPARAKYWATKVLEKRKIRNLVKYCGMTQEAASKLWRSMRKGRVKT